MTDDGATFDRVLVATDFSVASERAVHTATDLARGSGGELLILHVVPATEVLGVAGGARGGLARVEAALVGESEARMQGMAREAEQAGIRATASSDTGAPSEVILREAARFGATLIVLGAHGMGGLKRLVLGSVADAVARKAHVSVLLVR